MMANVCAVVVSISANASFKRQRYTVLDDMTNIPQDEQCLAFKEGKGIMSEEVTSSFRSGRVQRGIGAGNSANLPPPS